MNINEALNNYIKNIIYESSNNTLNEDMLDREVDLESHSNYKTDYDHTPVKYKSHLIYRGIAHTPGLKDKYIYSVDKKPSYNPKHIHISLSDAKDSITKGWYDSEQ